MTEIKILQPITNYIKEFESPDEFNLFYNKHKEEIDSTTTHKLNKLYHIRGYRITKIKDVLMLKKHEEKAEYVKKHEEEPEMNVQEEIRQMKETINKIIQFLNPHKINHECARTIVSPPSVTCTII